MIETHPFPPFVPENSRYLILGSFTGKMVLENSYDWYYGSKRNQFWKILAGVYGLGPIDKRGKQKFLRKLGIAITDIIYRCERKYGNNLDNNLVNIIYNTRVINGILGKNKIEKIFFTSRFVEKLFRKVFKKVIQKHSNIELITLPSPSPRYAKLSLKDKIKIYKDILPRL